ncbi:sulfotransferase [Gammaproteobacteria bacterium]|nr:sulfotransferase [Gammaproteobacteria bacterium]|tara:strand:+ start:1637 stop:3604 length:1968 start_codon:yes stop_codon:yes gene_type:complete
MSENSNLKIALNNAIDLLNNNNLNECLQQLEEILTIHPSNSEALSLALDINIKISNTEKAIEIINKLIQIDPTKISYYEKSVKIYQYLNDEKGYESALIRLHKKFPSISSARLISNLYIKNDKEEESNEVIQNFFESDKSYSDLYKGIRHVKAGRLKLAEEAYKNVIKRDKNNIDALRLLGLLAFKTKDYNIAERLFIRVLELDPTFSLAWDNLAKLFRIQNKLSKSIPAFENLIKLDPDNFEALVSLGTVYIKLSKYYEGINLYEKSLKIKPENPRVYLSLGHALKTVGEREKSETAYHNAIKYFPFSGEAYWSLANLKTYKFSQKEISNMELSINKNMHPNELIQMHFALGKAYESNNQFEKSFNHYREGNWLQRKQIKYNAEDYKISIDEIIDFFKNNNDIFKSKSSLNNDDPIFILGLPRSGSTLIEQILSSHSLIEGTQELPNIMAISRDIKLIDQNNGYPKNLLAINSSVFNDFGQKYIDETRWARSSKPFFIDKMPNNFVHIGLIKLILPNAKIIDARRNPMDSCFSCFKQYFAKGQHFTYDLDDIARYYKDYLRLMNFWNELFPGEIFTINYEDVINEPNQKITELLSFCNVEFEDSCLNFHKSKRPVKTASSEQVRQPMYKTGLDYWKNYRNNLDILINHFPDYDK